MMIPAKMREYRMTEPMTLLRITSRIGTGRGSFGLSILSTLKGIDSGDPQTGHCDSVSGYTAAHLAQRLFFDDKMTPPSYK